MSTLSERLRDLAADLEREARLVPIPANEVSVGDVVSFTVGELVKLTAIETKDHRVNSNGAPLIGFDGEVVDATEYEPRFGSYFADEWVVVKR